jgi:hypothetical protein
VHRFTASLRTAARSDAGASMVELSFQFLAAFVLVALAVVAFNRVVGGGGTVPLEQCIEHQSCGLAAQAHGL